MGSHYGKSIREREGKSLKTKRARHECPSCGKTSVKNISYALWKCRSCGTEFAGGAYEPETMVGKTVKKTIQSIANTKKE